MSPRIGVAVETGTKKVFATAVDWPGWSRSGKTADLALEALTRYGPRYASVAREADESFADDVAAGDLEVVEQAEGGSGTEFGVPSRVTDADRRPVSEVEADRLCRLVGAAWTVFDRVAAKWLEGDRPKPVDPAGALAALQGIRRLLVVGIEADFLDALGPDGRDVGRMADLVRRLVEATRS